MIGALRWVVAAGMATLAMGLPAAAEVTGEVVDWGITTGRREPGPDTFAPGEQGLAPASRMSDIRHVERTDTVEARLCRSFGITVRLEAGQGGGIPRRVEGRIAHPTMTRPDGVTGSEARATSEVFGGTTYVGFSFDEPWEIAPGTWTFSVVVEGVEVARQSFTVVEPPPGAPKSECVPDTVT